MSRNINKTRAVYKGKITQLIGKINQASKEEKILIYHNIIQYQKTIEQYDAQIIESLDIDTEISKEIDDVENYHKGVNQLLQTLKPQISDSSINTPNTTSSTMIQNSHVKLPKIKN